MPTSTPEPGDIVILFRPVGLEELRLIDAAGMRAFPPRLPEQPIFYPVLNEDYARQIARDWNTNQGSRAGFVTRFEVEDVHVAKFERHVVGGRVHEELWVPAEDLEELNRHIVGGVEVVAAYFGDRWLDFVGDAAATVQLLDRIAVGVGAGGDHVLLQTLRTEAAALRSDVDAAQSGADARAPLGLDGRSSGR
jgi:hypothetical protein